jgi:hypothetical protein
MAYDENLLSVSAWLRCRFREVANMEDLRRAKAVVGDGLHVPLGALRYPMMRAMSLTA